MTLCQGQISIQTRGNNFVSLQYKLRQLYFFVTFKAELISNHLEDRLSRFYSVDSPEIQERLKRFFDQTPWIFNQLFSQVIKEIKLLYRIVMHMLT